jgi:thiamine pyrophosphate-dependent acetolactate synthase large subunit-like protein
VLIDLPFDVQMAEIEFDIDTYEPLPVYKPAATRKQIEKALAMLNAAERPLIVAGGGIINADASDLLQEFAELVGVPVIPTLMGWGAIPDDHPLMAGMCGLQTSHRYGNATMLASDFVLGIGNRWANRHTGSPRGLLQGPQVRARRHRAHPDRPRVRARLRHRLRRQGAALEPVRRGGARDEGRRHAARLGAWVAECQSASARCTCARPTSTTCR